MFALEIDFHDGVSPPETLFVRRPHAIIGASDYAHVVIEGASSSLYELRLTRGVGAEFRCQPISRAATSAPPTFLEGVYAGETEINLGEVTTHITSLDVDLQLEDDESPDRAGVRILRRALVQSSPIFPAIAVLGSIPLFLSFPSDAPVVVGRSRRCGLRLDSADVSGEHARIGYDEQGFWIEDLGSTNGTFVDGQRISGRFFLEANQAVDLAGFTLVGLEDQDGLQAISSQFTSVSEETPAAQRYPCVVGASDVVRPAEYVLTPGSVVTIGRDPANDIWIGAAHVSRTHVELHCAENGSVTLVDVSSNGTFLGGQRLESGQGVDLQQQLARIGLGANIELGVCFAEDDERVFTGQPIAEAVDAEKAQFSYDLGETHLARDAGSDEAAFRDVLHRDTTGSFEGEARPEESSGVFAKLAERARAAEGDDGAEPEPTSDYVAYEEAPKTPYDEGADYEDLKLEESPVLGRLARATLGLAVVVLAAIVSFLLVWFVGGDVVAGFIGGYW